MNHQKQAKTKAKYIQPENGDKNNAVIFFQKNPLPSKLKVILKNANGSSGLSPSLNPVLVSSENCDVKVLIKSSDPSMNTLNKYLLKNSQLSGCISCKITAIRSNLKKGL